MCWATSTSISAWLSTRTPSFRKSTSPSASALRTSSASAMLTLSAIVVGSPIVGFGDLDGNHTVAVTVNRPPLDSYTPLWTLPRWGAVHRYRPRSPRLLLLCARATSADDGSL